MKSFKNDFLKESSIKSYFENLLSIETNSRMTEFNSLESALLSKLNTSEKGASLATLGNDGKLSLSQRPSQNVFIFRPGETSPSYNVFNNWTNLISSLANTKGLKYIQLDDTLEPLTIPLDTSNLNECTLLPRYKKQNHLVVNFTNGFKFLGLPLEIIGLRLQFSSRIFDSSSINALNLTDSILEYTSNVESCIDLVSGNFYVFLKNSSIQGINKTVFSVRSNSLHLYAISGLCNVDSSTITGSPGGILNIVNQNANFLNQNSFVGSQVDFTGQKNEIDSGHILEKTLTQKGQILTKDLFGNWTTLSTGLDNELFVFDSSSASGHRVTNLNSLLGLPGMKSVEYLRQSSPNTTLLSSGNRTLDCSISNLFRITGGNATFTITNLSENQVVNVVLESTGSSYTITWSGGTFYWPNSTVPTPTVISLKKDFYTFIKVGGNIFSSCLLAMG
ncbi:hypothetical protein [Leptospira mayottensis]|uniref:Uncharacterized protein n=2 Tax=Leptospira mayottensis TaxID=1137606 RepID=A0AA87SUI5_9LEPT|nr:hypothetical protein [Leptospira mayottensis]AXR66624.1 hypothetical protein DQM28_20765 [Leptospira mayottensis]AZQ04266.1 hypothetical protein LEP1GSC190_19700 [Leptospira mayottensis 200901116]EKR98079.1 hypothetical protein LEP1GSC125_1540 [Leptospira mayottensis 200901122]TGN04333.1 hypothetical protein EHR03_10855 [Leptospira mayottensis]